MNGSALKFADTHPFDTPKVPEAGFHACSFEFGEDPISRLSSGRHSLDLPASLNRAVPKRQAEFLAGRYCAHRASEALGCRLNDLPIGPDRAPVWPESMVGSITHTDGLAACLVGPKHRYRGLGLDMEGVIPESSIDALHSLIVVDEERAVLDSLGDERQALTLLFSAKEAIYKAIQPTVQRYVDFKEVQYQARASNRLTFSVGTRLASEIPDLPSIVVHVERSQSLITTWCVLEQPTPYRITG